MSGLIPLLGKEFREIRRTWRIWLLPGLMVALGVSGPPLARYTRELLGSVMGEQAGALPLPNPTFVDAYLQWTKNLGQLVLFAVVITLGTVVSGELRSGTAVLVLTKPVSRAAFVTAKLLANLALVAAAAALGVLATWAMTRLFFTDAPAGRLGAATATWLVLAALLAGLVVLGSCLARGGTAASGLGLAVYLVLAVASMWGPAARFTPAGLVSAPEHLVRGADVALGWPVGTGLLAVVAAWGAAVWVLRRREL